MTKYRTLQKIDAGGCSRWYPQKRVLFFFWVMDKSPYKGETVDEVGFPSLTQCEEFLNSKHGRTVVIDYESEWEEHLRNEK